MMIVKYKCIRILRVVWMMCIIIGVEGSGVCERKIPKVIHQTFYTYGMEAEYADIALALRRRNEEYSYRFYDDYDALKVLKKHERELPPYTVDTFRRVVDVMGAVKADLFRYAVLYIYGGVYLDLDSTLKRPIDSMIKDCDRYICIKQKVFGHDGCVQQFMMSSAGHSLMYNALNMSIYNLRACTFSNNGMWFGALQSTGPIMLALEVKKYIRELETMRNPRDTITFMNTTAKNIWTERAGKGSGGLYGKKKNERYYFQLKRRYLLQNNSEGKLIFLRPPGN